MKKLTMDDGAAKLVILNSGSEMHKDDIIVFDTELNITYAYIAMPCKSVKKQINFKKRKYTKLKKNNAQLASAISEKGLKQRVRINAIKKSKKVCVRYSLNTQVSQQINSCQKRKRKTIKKENARKCPVCGGMFKNTVWCKRHIKQKHEKVVNILNPEIIEPLEEDFLCCCEQCGRLFEGKNAKKNVRHHKLAVHAIVKPHHCSVCGKGFPYKFLCIGHMANCREDTSQARTSKSSKISNKLNTPHVIARRPKEISSNQSKSKINHKKKFVAQEVHQWPVLVQESPPKRQHTKKAVQEAHHWPVVGQESSENKQYRYLKRIMKLNWKPSVKVPLEQTDTSSNPFSSLLSKPVTSSLGLNNTISKESLSCPKCDRVFSGVYSHMCLRNHYFTHISESPYTCPVCNHGFISYFGLSRHYRKAHLDCPALPISASNPNVAFCMKCFHVCTGPDAKIALSKHYKTIHRAPKLHVCVACDRKFKCKANLINHTKNIHGEIRDLSQKLPEKELHETANVSSTFKAISSTCSGRRFESESLFKKHQTANHCVVENNFAAVVHSCSSCNERFKIKSEFREHIRHCHDVSSKNDLSSGRSSVNNCASRSDDSEAEAVKKLRFERGNVSIINESDGSMSATVKTEIDLDDEDNSHNSNGHQVLQMPSKSIWKPYVEDSSLAEDNNTQGSTLSVSGINSKLIGQSMVYTCSHDSDKETPKENDSSEKSCGKCGKMFKGPNAFTMLRKHKSTHWAVKLGQFYKKSSESRNASSNDSKKSHEGRPELQNSSQHETSRSSNKIYTCSDCGLKFKNFSLLLNHKKVIHHYSHGSKRYGNNRHCDKCNKVFTGPLKAIRLSQHKRIHWSDKSNDSQEADLSVETNLSLHETKNSIKIIQPKDQKLRNIQNRSHCEQGSNQCGKVFAGSLQFNNLIRHKRYHLPANSFTCKDCGKEFANGYQFQNHMVNYHGKNIDCRNLPGAHSCKQCCAVYTAGPAGQALLQRHMLVHECQNKVFACEHCGWVFFSMSALYKHRVRHHKITTGNQRKKTRLVRPNQKFKINRKSIVISQQVESNVAVKSEVDLRGDHRKNECHTQNAVDDENSNKNLDLFGVVQSLSRYNRKISTAHLSSSYDYEHVPVFDNQLQRAINESSDLYQRVSNSKNDSLVSSKSNAMSAASKSYACSDCGRIFSVKQSCKRHMLFVHKKNLFKNYKSKVAYSGLTNKSNLKNYMNSVEEKKIGHSDEASVRHCKKCNRIFNGPNSYMKLWFHMHSHSLVKPYTCPECNKGFVFHTGFKSHMKNAHGKVMNFRNFRVYSCVQCTATFGGEDGKQLLKKHMLTHKNVTCDLTSQSRDNSKDNKGSMNRVETLQQFPEPNRSDKSQESGCVDLTSDNESECNSITTASTGVCASNYKMSISEPIYKKTELNQHVMLDSVTLTTNTNLSLPDTVQTVSGSNGEVSSTTAHLSTSYDYEQMLNNPFLPRDSLNAFNNSQTIISSKNDSLSTFVFDSTSPVTNAHICPDCGNCFSSRQSCQRHALSIHKKNIANPSREAYSGGRKLKQKSQMKNCKKNSLDTRINNGEGLAESRCKKCNIVFYGRYHYQHLWKHMHSHSLVKPYTCPECKLWFVFPRELNVHMKKVHGKVIDGRSLRISSCGQCDAKFTGVEGKLLLRKHMLTHKNICPFSCVHCGCGFVSNCSLRNHIKRRHNNLKGQSSEHGRTANTDKSVHQLPDQIITIQSKNVKFDCIDLTSENDEDYVCTKEPERKIVERFEDDYLLNRPNDNLYKRGSFLSHDNDDRTKIYRSASLWSGNRRHEQNKISTSEQSSLKMVNEFPVNINNHIESLFSLQQPKMGGLSGKSYTCFECGMSFNLKNDLDTHESLNHRKIHTKTTKNEQQVETCDKCNTIFVGQNAATMLSKHYVKHATEISATSVSSNRFNCSECGYGCNLNIRLNIHLRNVHSDKCSVSSEGEIMTSLCDECPMVFKGPNSSSMMYKHKLIHHKNIHASVRTPPFSKSINHGCELCNCTFKNPNASFHLQQHMFSHLQIRPYFCYNCNRKFLLKSQLKSHMSKIHGTLLDNNTVGAQCALCKAVFSEKGALKEVSMLWKHIISHDNVSVHNCASCTINRFSAHFKLSNRMKKSANELKKIPNRIIETNSNFKTIKLNKSCQNYSSEKDDTVTFDKPCETLNSGQIDNSPSTSSGMRLRHNLPSWIFSHYSCEKCQVRFASKFRLNKHNKLHHENHEQNNQSTNTNPQVSVQNTFTEELKNCRNEEKKHEKQQVIRISDFSSSFDKKSILSLSECKICRKLFSSLNLHRKHIRRHGVHNCKICRMKFPIKEQLKKHMMTHLNVNYFCDTCFIPFTTSVSFQAHVRLHNRRKFRSRKNWFYVLQKAYARVRWINTRYICVICKREFRERGTLRGHVHLHENERDSHEGGSAVEERSSAVQEGSSAVQEGSSAVQDGCECLICKRSFSNNSLLDEHLRVFADQEVMSTTNNLVVPNALHPVGDPQFMCAYCLLEFFTQEEVKDHYIHTSCLKKAEAGDSN